MIRGMLTKIDGALEIMLRWGGSICLVGLLVIISAVVFVRFVPVTSMGWTDEVIEFAFAWMVFLCAAGLWRQGTHFRVEVVTDWLGGSTAGRGLKIFLGVISLGFLGVFTYEGWLLAIKATDRSPIFEFPKTL
ncbi:MAG: TRAP transporter small permease subunit, partial [Deltaproteobacteria bacterium]|nr:TRAP transporter small permease subunit [Deltaproteobacteria bacterium]